MIQSTNCSVFFADLHHPGGQDADIDELFSSIPSGTTRIFFLGDTFHYWINETSFVQERYALFLARMRQWAEQGIDLFFLEGNRDFLATHYLERQAWIDILPNPSIIDVAGRVVYIGHGDELTWNDWPYQLYKTCIRSLPMRILADHLPAAFRKKAVKKMAEASTVIVASKDRNMLAIPEKAYRQVIESGVDLILHGHIHQSYQRDITTPMATGSVIAFGWKDGKRNFLHLEG